MAAHYGRADIYLRSFSSLFPKTNQIHLIDNEKGFLFISK